MLTDTDKGWILVQIIWLNFHFSKLIFFHHDCVDQKEIYQQRFCVVLTESLLVKASRWSAEFPAAVCSRCSVTRHDGVCRVFAGRPSWRRRRWMNLRWDPSTPDCFLLCCLASVTLPVASATLLCAPIASLTPLTSDLWPLSCKLLDVSLLLRDRSED